MAHYCIHEERSHNCGFLYKGTVIGTDKKLCNIFSDEKPCEEESIQKCGLIGDVCDEDFIEFFGKTREETLKPYYDIGKDETILKRILFKDSQFFSASDVINIYKNSDYYFVLLNYIRFNYFEYLKNIELIKNFIYELCAKEFLNPKGIKILDYGCGTGQYGLKLALMGYDVTLADIGHKTFKFLQFICKKHNLNVKFQELTENYCALEGKFDYIICTDVLEHVCEPEHALKTLIEHLDDNGIMYLATFFDDMMGQDPSHLKRNTIRYNFYQGWLGRVVQMGLVPIYFDGNGCDKGFRKIKAIKELYDKQHN